MFDRLGAPGILCGVGKFVRFPSTMWTMMLSRPERARAQLFNRYRTPILHFIRNHGFNEHDAEDLTQEVFLRVSREEFLSKVDRRKGRFRNLLLAVTRHVCLKERDRLARRRAGSIEQADVDHPAPPDSDEAFQVLWVQNLVNMALEGLQTEATPDGPRYYEALLLSRFKGLTYEEVARKLGVGVGDVKNWIYAAKKKVKVRLVELIRAYCSTDGELDEEWAYIRKSLK